MRERAMRIDESTQHATGAAYRFKPPDQQGTRPFVELRQPLPAWCQNHPGKPPRRCPLKELGKPRAVQALATKISGNYRVVPLTVARQPDLVLCPEVGDRDDPIAVSYPKQRVGSRARECALIRDPPVLELRLEELFLR